jgi:hypothetical protein
MRGGGQGGIGGGLAKASVSSSNSHYDSFSQF